MSLMMMTRLTLMTALVVAAPAASAWTDPTPATLVKDVDKAVAAQAKALDKMAATKKKLGKSEATLAKKVASLRAKADKLEKGAKRAEKNLPAAEKAVKRTKRAWSVAKRTLRKAKKAGNADAAQSAADAAKKEHYGARSKVKRYKKALKKGSPGAVKKLRSQADKAEGARKKAADKLAKATADLDAGKKRFEGLKTVKKAAKHAQKGKWEKAVGILEGAPSGGKVGGAASAFITCAAGTRGVPNPAVAKACEQAGGTYNVAYRHLGVSAARGGDMGAAAAALKNARLAKDDAAGQLALGRALVATGKAKQAVKPLQTGLKLDPKDAAGHEALGDAYLKLGKKKQAVTALTAAYKIQPARKNLRYRLAKLHDSMGNPSQSEALLTEYVGGSGSGSWDKSYAACERDLYHTEAYGFSVKLSASTNKALARAYVGAKTAGRGATDEAARHFSAALALAPKDPQVLYNAAVFNLGAGRYTQAKGQFEAVLKSSSPLRAWADVNLGITELRLKNQKAAMERLGALAGKDARARIALGVALARKNDGQAPSNWSGFDAKSPLVTVARHNLAAWALGSRDLATADKHAAGLTATFPELHLLRGQIALERGNGKAARDHLTKALAMNGSYLRARLAMGQALLAAGQSKRAVGELRGAVALDPACPDTHTALGAALGKTGDTKGEAAEYRKAEALREAARKRAARLAGKDPDAEGDEKKSADAKRVAVVRFLNTTQNPKHDWLTLGIPEAVSTDLQKLSNLVVVERGQVANLMKEIKFASLDFVDEKTAPKIGKLIGADSLVVGSFQVVGGNIKMLGRLVDLKTRQVLEQASVDGPMDGLFALQRKLALQLVGKYAKVSQAEQRKVKGGKTASVSALEKLALMRQKMLAGDKKAARAAYREAMAQSPDYVGRMKNLKKAYQEAQTRLAVVPFKNTTQKPDDDWLGEGIATALANDMKKLGLPVVERMLLAKVMKERKFQAVTQPDKAKDLGQLAGAGVILIGSYQVFDDVLSINARMVQVQSGAVVLTERVTGPKKEVLQLQTKLAEAMAKALEMQLSPEELAALTKDRPDFETFKNSVLKDRLFVIKDRSPEKDDDDGDGGLANAGPIISTIVGVAVGIGGAVMYGVGDANAAEYQLEIDRYDAAVGQAEIDARYARAEELNDLSNGLKIGAYVSFGVAAGLLIYGIVGLAMDDDDEGEGSVDVALPRPPLLAPAITPNGASLQLQMGF